MHVTYTPQDRPGVHGYVGYTVHEPHSCTNLRPSRAREGHTHNPLQTYGGHTGDEGVVTVGGGVGSDDVHGFEELLTSVGQRRSVLSEDEGRGRSRLGGWVLVPSGGPVGVWSPPSASTREGDPYPLISDGSKKILPTHGEGSCVSLAVLLRVKERRNRRKPVGRTRLESH